MGAALAWASHMHRGPRGVRSWNACTRVTVEEYTGVSVAPVLLNIESFRQM
jgi:hypothetical protein